MSYLPENVSPHLGESVVQHYKAFINFFRDRVQHYRDNIYMRYYTNGIFKTLTYGQVDCITTNLACKLAKIVPSELETVAFMNDHEASYLIVTLAMMKLRKALFTISPRNSEAAVANLIEKTNTKFIISSHKYEQTARNAIAHMNDVEYMMLEPFDFESLAKEPLNSEHTHLLNYEFTDEDINKPAIILHSSGSTSFPKPMFAANRYLFNAMKPFHININARKELPPITEEDVFISIAPLFHLIGFVEHTTVILYGASVVFLEKLPPSQEEIDYALGYNKVTMILTAPIFLEQMIHYLKQKQDYTNVKRLKYTFFGGAALKDESAEWLSQHNVRPRNVYGLTETSPLMCADCHPDNTNCNSVRPYHPLDYYIFEEEDPSNPDLVHVAIRAGSPNLANNAANRPDGGFDTNDIFRKDPERPGFFYYVGRRDDTLVMSTGEKTNPLPMEATLRETPMVKQAAVLGHERPVTCALIELNTEYAWNYSPDEIIREINEAVAKVNKECPSQSTLIPEMVKILPFKDKLPVTDKGSLMRKKALAEYKTIIDTLYDNFLNGSISSSHSDASSVSDNDASTWSLQQIEDFLVKCASDILKVSTSVFSKDLNESIFNLGFNSINGIQLRNRICEHFDDVSQNFLYQHSTIKGLSEALAKNNTVLDAPMEIEKRYQETQELAAAYMKKAEKDFPIVTSTNYGENEKVVLLTGATGSIGSFILSNLLQDASVTKVYCLVRGKEESLHGRLVDAFKNRFLDTSLLLDTDRLEVLPMKLNEKMLGLGEEKYNQLTQEVTIVQHCAWLLDFNMTIDYYDKECIDPFYQLLQFAYRPVNPMHVHFISSISASAALGAVVPEEPLPLDAHVAMPMGYAQSKFVVEVLLNYLTTEKNFPCYIERVGQVCGDSVHGVWNTTEQYPLMIVAGGSSVMNKMPALESDIDWIPVDYAAKAITEIMIETVSRSADIDQSIYHIVNPRSIAWSDVLRAMKESGMEFDTVAPSEWVECVSKDTTNPCYRLISFYESTFSDSLEMPVWKTEKTRQIAASINQAPVFNSDLLQKYLSHWQSIGFYNP